MLRAGPFWGNGGVLEPGDGVPHPAETRVVGPVWPHGGGQLAPRELVLVGACLLQPEHEHLPSRHSAAAGRRPWPWVAVAGRSSISNERQVAK